MSDTSDTQVLIAGGGPVGLTAAIELARRGIPCRIVDPLLEPPRYAKAVGVQLLAHVGATFAGPEGDVTG
jgi:pentachlorophenol monooxygenase